MDDEFAPELLRPPDWSWCRDPIGLLFVPPRDTGVGYKLNKLSWGSALNISLLTAVFGNVSIAAGLLLVAVLVVVQIRTKSSHVLAYRLWRLVADKHEVSDEKIRTFLDAQLSLMSFRFMSGLRADTIDSAHRLIDWTKHHQVDIGDLRMVGRHFDSQNLVITNETLPSQRYQRFKLAGMGVALLMAGVMSVGITSESAALSFKDNGKLFLLSHESARRMWPLDSPSLTSVDCGRSAAQSVFGFSSKELAILCEGWQTPAAKAFIDETVSSQRWSLLVIALCLFYVAAQPAQSYRRGLMAKRIAAKIDAVCNGASRKIEVEQAVDNQHTPRPQLAASSESPRTKR